MSRDWKYRLSILPREKEREEGAMNFAPTLTLKDVDPKYRVSVVVKSEIKTNLSRV